MFPQATLLIIPMLTWFLIDPGFLGQCLYWPVLGRVILACHFFFKLGLILILFPPATDGISTGIFEIGVYNFRDFPVPHVYRVPLLHGIFLEYIVFLKPLDCTNYAQAILVTCLWVSWRRDT